MIHESKSMSLIEDYQNKAYKLNYLFLYLLIILP
jgi:hypothetical protein